MEQETVFETSEHLEIIDTGIETEDLMDLDMVCCWGAFAPYRW